MTERLASESSPATLRSFRLFSLDVAADTGIITGPGGTERVDPKVMAVLVELAARPGELVSRDDLLLGIWDGRAVSEHVISRSVYHLRQHLEAASGKQEARSWVETLPKRGYRLNATVQSGHGGIRRIIKRFPFLLIVLPLAALPLLAVMLYWSSPRGTATSSSAPVIAVLPFVDRSKDGEIEYFADGISDELIDELMRIAGLRVIARSSSFAFKGRDMKIEAIFEQLDASHIIDGSVEISSDGYRISAELIESDSNLRLWSQSFDVDRGEIFLILKQIARAVADTLNLELRGDNNRSSASSNQAALDAFLRARFLHYRRNPGDLEKAAELYREAIELDEHFADAWAGLSSVSVLRISTGELGEKEGLILTGMAANRALAITPEHPEALARMAMVQNLIGNEAEALDYWRRAMRKADGNPLLLAMRAASVARDGDFPQSIRLSERALRLDPLSTVNRANFVNVLIRAGYLSRAHQEALKLLPLLGEGEIKNHTRRNLIIVHILLDRIEEAIRVSETLTNDQDAAFAEALILIARDQGEEAAQIIANMQGSDDPSVLLDRAQLQAFKGDHGDAIDSLKRLRAVLQRNQDRLAQSRFESAMKSSPFLAWLADDPKAPAWTGNEATGF